jgi:hypothetical protein
MAGRHPNALRPRDETAHPLLQDALDKGYLDSMQEYVVSGFPDNTSANEGRLAVRRAARHFNVAVAAFCKEQPDGTWSLHFRCHNKNAARAYVVQQTGGDPTKLKYNPFKKTPKRDDDGNE